MQKLIKKTKKRAFFKKFINFKLIVFFIKNSLFYLMLAIN